MKPEKKSVVIFNKQTGLKFKRLVNMSLLMLAATLPASAVANYTVLGWNNLGMHCMDADFSVLCLLPPYNTIHAQVIDSQGHLLTLQGGFSVSYQAMADPDGSINTISAGKTNFWQFVSPLFGLSLPVDVGLPVPGPNSFAMPGADNLPQSMQFENNSRWFAAYGIPITPIDDSGLPNAYPMMRLTIKSGATTLASSDIVLPVSAEMDCRACHASGSGPAAMPQAGWVNEPNVQRDFRLNILRIHDERMLANPLFTNALATAGYDANGLYATVANHGVPILCARCHLSEALPGSGINGIPPLTQVIHTMHGTVTDPTNNLTLDAADNRSACYRCHPGSTTRCLRGAMGKAVASDGTMLMQCQSCHGSMSVVGAANRTGWLNEPACQNCHTGTAISNNGQIRYDSAFTVGSQPRTAVDATFATNANAPAAGLSLYRFSSDHGGLYCEACHGSTHAEFPSSHKNDNLYSIKLQRHEGMLVECLSCHPTMPNTINGGPHGLHPISQSWATQHSNAVENNGAAQCRVCHGADYTGTVLSRAQANRTFNTGDFGTKFFWRGYQIGCFTCHNGPGNESRNINRLPITGNASVVTGVNTRPAIPLSASDPENQPLTLRIVSQTIHGTVGLSGTVATYFPDPNYIGQDSFTFAAWDGQLNSNLATVTIIAATPFSIFGTVTTDGVGQGGVMMTLTSGALTVSTALTDASGAYSFTSLATGNYVVTPTKTGFLYTPFSRNVTLNGTNFAAAQNFSTTQNRGTVTVKKATVSASGKTAVTKGPLWAISGTGTPGATINIFLGSDLTGEFIGSATVSKRGTWKFRGRVLVATPLSSVAGISISSSDGAIVLNHQLTTVLSAKVSTRGTKATLEGPLWNVRGTGSPGTVVSIFLSPNLTGQLIGTTTVAPNGKWNFRGRVAVTLPVTATSVSVSSSAGGAVLNQPLKVK
jgi:hypothetical protein